MFVRKVKRQTTKNISVHIAHRNAQGQPRQKIVRHRGSAPAGEIFRALLRLAEVEKQRMEEEVHPSLFPREEPVDLVLRARKQREQDKPLPVKDLRKLKEVQRLTMGFHEIFGAMYTQLGFGSRKKMARPPVPPSGAHALGEAWGKQA